MKTAGFVGGYLLVAAIVFVCLTNYWVKRPEGRPRDEYGDRYGDGEVLGFGFAMAIAWPMSLGVYGFVALFAYSWKRGKQYVAAITPSTKSPQTKPVDHYLADAQREVEKSLKWESQLVAPHGVDEPGRVEFRGAQG